MILKKVKAITICKNYNNLIVYPWIISPLVYFFPKKTYEFRIILLLSIVLIVIYFHENVYKHLPMVYRLNSQGLQSGCWGVNEILYAQIASLYQKNH